MKLRLFCAGALLVSGGMTVPVLATESIFQDVIVVTARRATHNENLILGEQVMPLSPDTGALVARMPGAALIKNGSLSGQVHYRGAYGVRVSTRVNGQAFRSGGPNLMDPPMHYAPPALVDTIAVNRGAAPVSFGPSLIGGVQTQLKEVGYGDSALVESSYDLTVIGRTADQSHAVGAVAGIANDTFRAFGLLSTEEGGDADWPDGEIANTHHERNLAGAGIGLKTGRAEWHLEVRRQETGPTGNPPFAMDIEYIDTDFAQFGVVTTMGEMKIDATVGYSDVDHGMTNFRDRPPPASRMRYRSTRAGARTKTFEVNVERTYSDRVLSFGFDIEQAELGAKITNPNNGGFSVEPLPDIAQDRAGLYANWQQEVGGGSIDVGLRLDRHDDQASEAGSGVAVPAMPTMLAEQFNAKDRRWQDTTVDAVVRFSKPVEAGTWRLSLARKTRAPSHLERYGWLPIAASAGLADGNNYLGDLNLDPEVAFIGEVGLDMTGARWWMRPTVFYHQVDNFIQGVPFDSTPGVIDSPVEMVSMMNGDMTPLRFANVDARMFGIDADWGWQLSEHWRLEGIVSIVRGERRDTSDDLYRLSPDRLATSLVFEQRNWSVSLEGVAVRAQNHVSGTNSEETTSGYGLLNLNGSWRLNDGMLISAGVENILDRDYRDHLSGYNRIRGADVGVGERLPGVGRNLVVRFSIHR